MATTTSPNELELKLELSADGVAALAESNLLEAQGKETRLRATYFDTPDHALMSAGLSLRIRKSGRKRVQTIKAGAGAAGLFDRDEWELVVEGDMPVPDDRSPLGDVLNGSFDALAPVFEVPVRRRIVRVGGIEVALDQGEALAGERREPIREVELELIEGDAADLFALARRIDKHVSVRIGVLAKAERGYRLLAERAEAVRADKVRLDPGASPAEAFAIMVHACLRQYRLNEDILLDRESPEAVHQARVALRRLRSAMTLFTDVLGPERRKLSGRLRDLAKVLGDARDLDVLATAIEPGKLRDRVEAARTKAYAAMSRTLNTKAARRLPLDCTEWAATGAWRSDPETALLRETPLQVYAAKALDRARKKLDKHGKHFAKLSVEQRHQVRKDAKKLRYGVEFLASLFADEKKPRKAFGKALKHLQEVLGTLNDHAAAAELFARLGLDETRQGRAFLTAKTTDEDKLIEDAATARRALLDIEPYWAAPAKRDA